MTEKRKPTYDLQAIKSAFDRPEKLAITSTALRDAQALGFTALDIVKTVQGLERKDFYKSMTSYADHRHWQDVYHARLDAGRLYVKFTADEVTEFYLLSFKELGNG